MAKYRTRHGNSFYPLPKFLGKKSLVNKVTIHLLNFRIMDKAVEKVSVIRKNRRLSMKNSSNNGFLPSVIDTGLTALAFNLLGALPRRFFWVSIFMPVVLILSSCMCDMAVMGGLPPQNSCYF